MRKFLFLAICLCSFISGMAQIKSPDAFLGYPVGSRYTPHFKIVDYFRYLASALPDRMKLQQYGATNEGRPLLAAFISTPENIARLEDIRQNNLRLAGIGSEGSPASANLPVIVWLSYNVHGNETSSSEAAMRSIWELLNPAGTAAQAWLSNTVVVIDPCMNPDGRDRYVNWFNSVVGQSADPEAYTREHHEPWPGGRSNHYYFDLNRDWAWQTQVESQQRVKLYSQWLPQVHVDFHEQGINDPYYFAPAAEPFHDVITPWQREFQRMIGRNHARYFDQNGWLFFTKERFDLFYPSYGDTYPIYRGAIGMTYEQGGGGRGGAAVINSDGDTLRLYDRMMHHFTTGMSTIETASKNAGRLISEFRNYYDKARNNPSGEFKAYFLRADAGDRLKRLLGLLDRNGINWSYAAPGSYTGMNYFSGKQETAKSAPGDVIINSNQPNSTLLSVLFERQSHISDSVTYDITAWSIPYAYGVETIGLPIYVKSAGQAPAAETQPAITGNPLAYAIRWNGLASAKCLSLLLEKGIKVRYAEEPFEEGGQAFDRGTLLVVRTSNRMSGEQLLEQVREAAAAAGLSFWPVASGFVDKGYDLGSDKVRTIQPPRVTVLAGDGVSSLGTGEIWQFFDQQLHYPVHLVWAGDLSASVLEKTDVLILPDGNYAFLNDKSGADQLKNWVRAGGRLIALERAVAQLSKGDWGIKNRDESEKDSKDSDDKRSPGYEWLHRYEDRERDQIPDFIPGSIYKVTLDDSHPLAFGYGNTYYSLKMDDSVYPFLKDGGWNVGVIKQDSKVAGFVGSRLDEKLKDALVFGVQDMGRGEVIFMVDNPLFRSFWENGKLLFCNAVFLVGQ